MDLHQQELVSDTQVFYMSHEISRRIFRWVKKFKYSNAKPNGFFDIQNPTGFWIQIGTLFCGKVSAACQLPPPLISKWIYSLGPEIFELLCFRPLAPSVFGFFLFLSKFAKAKLFCRLRTLTFPKPKGIIFRTSILLLVDMKFPGASFGGWCSSI